MPAPQRSLANEGGGTYSGLMILLRAFPRCRVLACTALIFAGACTPAVSLNQSAASAGETIVYVVRHAEKAAEDPADPVLTPAGYARADSLAARLREAGVDRIVSSNRQRTNLTARPLARLRNLEVEVIGLATTVEKHAKDIADAIRLRPGSRVLVVGHSNTVGPILVALGGPTIGDLCDFEHSNLFILTISRSGAPRLLRETYGRPDPPADATCTPVSAR